MKWLSGACFVALVIGTVVVGATVYSGASVAGAPRLVSVHTAGSVSCPTPAHVAPTVTWPYPDWAVCSRGTVTQSSPTTATWHGGTLVAFGDEDGVVHVLNALTGAELSGWPQSVAAPAGSHGAIESSPTIAFLDGANRPPSIIVGSGSTWVSNSVGEVEAFRLDGAPRFVFRVGEATKTAIGVISSPAVGDVTGNGARDIVFGSWDHDLYALTASGSLVSGFPVNTADTVWSSPTLYRLPGSSVADIYLGSDASGLKGCFGGWVSDYRYTAGAPNLVWRHCESQSIWSSPAVGVLGKGGRAVVVVGTSFYEQPFPAGTDRLYAYYATSGQPVPGWPVITSGPALGSPAIGPINSSGNNAVVDTSWVCDGARQADCFTGNSSRVSAWDGSGRLLWSDRMLGPTDLSSPVLVSLGDHRWNDVLVGSPNGLYPIGGADGSYLFGTTPSNPSAAINPGCRVFNAVAVADVAGSGPTSGWHVFEACGGPPTFHTPGQLFSYALPANPVSTPAWPMFRATSTHTGVEPAVTLLKQSSATTIVRPSPASLAVRRTVATTTTTIPHPTTTLPAPTTTVAATTTTTIPHPTTTLPAPTTTVATTTTLPRTRRTTTTTTTLPHTTTTTLPHTTTTTTTVATTTTSTTTPTTLPSGTTG